MTPKIEYIESHIIYENPRPHVRSRHAYQGAAVQLPSGDLLAMFVIGEAFESANTTTHISRSHDLGKTWQLEGPMYDKSLDKRPNSDYFKPQVLRDGTVIALGYCFYRDDPEQPIAIPKTDGFLPGDDLVSFSKDEGRTWTIPQVIPRTYPELYEIPSRPVQLKNGDVVATGGIFTMPDGTNPSSRFGILLRSKDNGRTWDDRKRFFETPSKTIAAYEHHICEFADGRLVTICWAYDTVKKMSLTNHITVSHDGGKTWSDPIDTGHMAESANLMYLGGERFMAIQCHRGEEIGLYVRVIDFRNDKWNVIAEKMIFGPSTNQQNKQGQAFAVRAAGLRFGQASLMRLTNGDILATHWAIEDGQGRLKTHRLRVHEA